jgi:hypothetical protein
VRIVNVYLKTNGISPGSNLPQAVQLMRDAGLTDEECGLAPGQLR